MSDLGIEHTADGEVINMHSDKDINVYAAHDESIEITNDRTIKVVNGTHTETIKGDTTIKITDGKLDHDVASGTSKHHVKGSVTEIYEDTQTTDVKNAIAITSDTSSIYIHGCTSIQLHVGASKLWMDSDGNILLEGKNIQIHASAKLELVGDQVVSTGKTNHEINGAAVKSAATGNNVVSGAMVMLNP
jgi:type VI secretion system secreted protein VgrG